MSALFGGMIKMLGVIFAVLVLGFTGFQTWSLLHEVSGNLVISIIGLALFEGGMLYWWAIFQYEAEGLGQLVAPSVLMPVEED